MTNTSFTKKRIKVELVLGSGNFGAKSDANTKIIEGLRVECEISKDGHPSKNGCKLKIYGMIEADMNTLSVKSFAPLAVRKNMVRVSVGDDSFMSVAFTGEITESQACYHTPPNLYFQVEALAGFYPSIAPSQPRSFKGAIDAKALLTGLASEMGYPLEDNGVTTKLSNQYLHGDAYSQASQVADAANLEFGIDDGVMFIAPRGKARKTKGEIPLLNAKSGMKEYPIFDKKGLRVECLYNPNIQLGGLIKIESRVANACGVWRVNGISHHLESENPGGQWLSKIKASYVSEG